MPFNLGLPEVLIVLVLALLFLGPKRLPEAGRSLGRGIREFKDGISGNDEDSREARQLERVAESAAPGLYAAPGVHASGRAHAPTGRVALPWRVPAASGRTIS